MVGTSGTQQSLPEYMLALARDGDPEVQILSAECLTNLHREGVCHPKINPAAHLMFTILRIVKDEATAGRCPARGFRIIARLVEEDEHLQQIAATHGVSASPSAPFSICSPNPYFLSPLHA